MDNIKGYVNIPEWHNKQSPNKQQCSRQGRDQTLQASLWEKKCINVGKCPFKYHHHKMQEDRYLPVHHYWLVHLIKKGNIWIPA